MKAKPTGIVNLSFKERKELAAMFGVGKQMISDIYAGRRWGHIQ